MLFNIPVFSLFCTHFFIEIYIGRYFSYPQIIHLVDDITIITIQPNIKNIPTPPISQFIPSVMIFFRISSVFRGKLAPSSSYKRALPLCCHTPLPKFYILKY